jgi:hypothetical protein
VSLPPIVAGQKCWGNRTNLFVEASALNELLKLRVSVKRVNLGHLSVVDMKEPQPVAG